MKKAAVLLSLATLLVAALAATPAAAGPHTPRAEGVIATDAGTAAAPAWTLRLPAWLQHVLELLAPAGSGPERNLAAASTEGDPDPDPCVGECTDGGVIGDPDG